MSERILRRPLVTEKTGVGKTGIYDGIKAGESFTLKATETATNRLSVHSAVKYDLIGKLAEGTLLTRKMVLLK
jgi:hypothetical protein